MKSMCSRIVHRSYPLFINNEATPICYSNILRNMTGLGIKFFRASILNLSGWYILMIKKQLTAFEI